MFHVDLDGGRGGGSKRSGEVGTKGRSLLTAGARDGGLERTKEDCSRKKLTVAMGPTLQIGLVVSGN